ncbi:MAG TPA: TIGR00730 family Rossman fold protein [Tepidisphaeraceae bacterium]|nr:TIGR00730 family Rossman fold protein [Tepidisphaeraceae bacterium]
MSANEDIEQTQETTQAPTVVSRAELQQVHQTAAKLIEQLEEVPDGDFVGQIVSTAIKLLRDQTNRGDIKLINSSVKELRYALKIFAPYRDVRKVAIFGSARTAENHVDYRQASEFGKMMAAAGWMVITGAGGGIMAAGHGGGGAEASFGLAIRLPFEQRTNDTIANDPKLVHFKYFFTRKLMFVRFSHAIALFPGGFGTMDEGFEVLTLVQTGKSVPMPIVFIDSPGSGYWQTWQDYVEKQLLKRGLIGPEDLRLYKITNSVAEAAEEIRHFYSNYHSIRYSRDEMVMRLHRAPNPRRLDEISRQFGDIAADGFRVSGPLGVERDEPSLSHLARLIFTFNRRDHGRLRMLIDHLNDLPD